MVQGGEVKLNQGFLSWLIESYRSRPGGSGHPGVFQKHRKLVLGARILGDGNPDSTTVVPTLTRLARVNEWSAPLVTCTVQ